MMTARGGTRAWIAKWLFLDFNDNATVPRLNGKVRRLDASLRPAQAVCRPDIHGGRVVIHCG
jgi:hypothetical protein